ncbi:MAG: glycosyltransferase [Lewinellaceae bacterium]|nr:glycosyltransferase [Saprospiraceae bacterium]MCB9311799.1 glycosyltransferase [Lewinellaceae bacterium]
MKVLVVSDYRPTNGVRPEAELFIRLAREGLQVDVMTYPGADYQARFEEAGIRVMTSHPRTKFSRGETRALRDLLIRERYDALHLFNSRAMQHGLRAARGLPVVVLAYRGYAGNVYWWDPSAYLKYLHPRIDGILCITREIQKSLQRQFWFRRDPTLLVTKGHDPAWYKGIPAASLQDLGIPEDAFVVISVANSRPFKDIPTLLKAAGLVRSERPIYWLLVGKGMDSPRHMRILRDSPARDRVIFAGFQPDPLRFMAASQVIVNCSVGGEGLNKTLIEGMSLGLPAIVTDIPGNREIVPSDAEGVIIPLRDPQALAAAVSRYAADEAFRQERANAGRQYIQSALHIDRSVEQMLQIYQSFAGRS